MSNYWIVWECIECRKRTTIQWVLQPGWPSGHVHLRLSYCQDCFQKRSDEFLVFDEAVWERYEQIKKKVAEKIPHYLETRGDERPVECLRRIGVEPDNASRAALAYAEYKNSLRAKRRWKRKYAESYKERMIGLSVSPDLIFLSEEEKELLRQIPSMLVKQDTSKHPQLIGNPHIQERLPERKDREPLEGEHDIYYVISETSQIYIPPYLYD